MDSIEPKPSVSIKSPEKTRPDVKPQPSDQITACHHHPPSCSSTVTPTKLPNPPRRFKYHRPSGRTPQLPEKYETLLRFFDALDASLRLLRLRKAIPTFTKIKAMVENMSERRFTYQHLAQLKFILPEEIVVKRVLLPDEITHYMKYDLHLKLNINMMFNTKKRKQGSKRPCLRDHFVSRLLQFLKAHPVGTEIPEKELPEPFNRQKKDLVLNTTKQSSSLSHAQKNSDLLEPAKASHFSLSFKKHFSKGDSSNKSGDSFPSPLKSSLQSPLSSVCKPSVNEDELDSVDFLSQLETSNQLEGEICCAQNVKTKATPIKSAGSPNKLMAATPALQTPKRCKMSPAHTFASSPTGEVYRPSCARSLKFGGSSRNFNIVLQEDDDECSNVLDILPETLLQSLKEKEKKITEQTRRKQMIASLPKLFDRIYLLFQSPNFSFIKKKALIRDLTERHGDITDESEVEEQLKLLREIIPDWIFEKLSPSGNILYR